MDEDGSHMTKRLLSLTLEIMYLLTGEDYTIVKKTSGERVALHSRLLVNLGHKRSHEQKILELTHKMIELLTGEEWEYLEGHKDLYKDVMMEDHRPLTSLGGSSNRNTPERRPRPLYTQDGHTVPQDDQGEALMDIKVEVIDDEEETCARGEEGTPSEISPGVTKSRKTFAAALISSSDCGDIAPDSPGEIPTAPICQPAPHSMADPTDPVEHSADQSHGVSQRRARQRDKIILSAQHGKRYNQKAVLSNHQMPGDKSFLCSVCGKAFTCKMDLVKHQRDHLSDKPYACLYCGKYFSAKSSLVDHRIRMHKGRKPFPCSECGKCFVRKYDVVRHQRSHTGEKPFLCSECGKYFAQKSNLVDHQKIHAGLKPFPCSECGKRFRKKSNLVTHQRIHTGEKPFPCSECGKCFTYKSTLANHKVVHKQRKLFQ